MVSKSIVQTTANPYVSSRMMASKVSIKHTSLSGVTPEQARNARARTWAYVFMCFNQRAKKEAARPGGGLDDGTTKDKEGDSANGNSIQ